MMMNKKELLFSVSVKHCEMQTYRGPGNGGSKETKERLSEETRE